MMHDAKEDPVPPVGINEDKSQEEVLADGNHEKIADEEAESTSWFSDDGGEDIDSSFKDYDITASPNDFNLTTIVNFIDTGPFKVPGFQRNYV